MVPFTFHVRSETGIYLDSMHILWNIVLISDSIPVARHFMNFSPWSFKTLSQIIQIIWNLLDDDRFSWNLLGWWFVWTWWMLFLSFLNKVCFHSRLKKSSQLFKFTASSWKEVETSSSKLTPRFDNSATKMATKKSEILLRYWQISQKRTKKLKIFAALLNDIATNCSKLASRWRKIPTCKHLIIRHFWHRCLIPALNKSQFPFPSLQVYSRPLMIVRRKKPLHPSQLK